MVCSRVTRIIRAAGESRIRPDGHFSVDFRLPRLASPTASEAPPCIAPLLQQLQRPPTRADGRCPRAPEAADKFSAKHLEHSFCRCRYCAACENLRSQLAPRWRISHHHGPKQALRRHCSLHLSTRRLQISTHPTNTNPICSLI